LSAYKIDTNTKDLIHWLVDLASERSKEEKYYIIDRLIDKILEGKIEEDKEFNDLKQKISEGKINIKNLTKEHSENKSESFKSGKDNEESRFIKKTGNIKSEEQMPPIQEKKKRGRPRKYPVPDTDPKYPCLSLLNHFKITDDVSRRRLEKLAFAAREKGKGRGIPQTEHPENYRFLRRGGPVPAEETYLIDGVKFKFHPPIVSKGSGRTNNAIWIEWEKRLLDIQEKTLSSEESRKLENEIGYNNKAIREKGIDWIEESPSQGGLGIPTINAETAREILRNSQAFKSISDLIDLAPASFLNENGEWNTRLSKVLRDVFLEKVFFGRKERFALSRILMAPIGTIELAIFRIAFPESCRVD